MIRLLLSVADQLRNYDVVKNGALRARLDAGDSRSAPRAFPIALGVVAEVPEIAFVSAPSVTPAVMIAAQINRWPLVDATVTTTIL